MQSAMDARFGDRAVVVNQRGAGGERAVRAPLSTLDHFNVFISRLGQAAPRAADVVVVNFGINDMRDDVPRSQYKAALLDCRATVYETPSPVVGGSAAYASAMRDVAAGKTLADVDAYVRSLPNWQR